MLQFRLCTLSARLCMLSARLCTLSLFVFSELCHGQFHKVPSFEILPGSVLAAERPKSFKTDFPSCSLVFGLLSLWASVLLSLSGGAHPSMRIQISRERGCGSTCGRVVGWSFAFFVFKGSTSRAGSDSFACCLCCATLS